MRPWINLRAFLPFEREKKVTGILRYPEKRVPMLRKRVSLLFSSLLFCVSLVYNYYSALFLVFFVSVALSPRLMVVVRVRESTHTHRGNERLKVKKRRAEGEEREGKVKG